MPPSSPEKSAERSDPLPPLDAFVRVARSGRTALVHPDYAREVADALLDGTGCVPADMGGRGRVDRFPYAAGNGIVRRYRRGGFVQRFLRESYLLVNRPMRELRVHHAAFEAALPVPMPLGIVWERRGPYLRGAIATREIDAVTLLDAIRNSEGDAALPAAGAAVRRMHDAGLYHADMQVRNLLLAGKDAYIIDLDNGRWCSMTPARRLRNLRRLQRSFRKEGIPDAAFWSFCTGYKPGLEIENALRARPPRIAPPCAPSETADLHVIVAAGIDEGAARAALWTVTDVLKVSAKSTTFRSNAWVVKASPLAFSLESMRLLAGVNRYWRTWEAIYRLRDQGVSLPAPVAYLAEKRWGYIRRAAVITEYLDGWVSVEEHARQLVRERADDGAIAVYLAAIASELRKLEKAGSYHADLSGKNILTEKGERFAFIDLDGVRFPRSISNVERLKNHIQLYDSFCDYWSDRLLRPFVEALWPPQVPVPENWFERVRMGQANRRARQQARWRKQGVPPPRHLETRE